ncbi:MAG: DegT/DnrJ/EryC1/StrS family aminotransferase [candidate division WOR-3 bacterium]
MTSATLPSLNLARLHRPFRGQLLCSLRAVIDRGEFILGPNVHELEKRIARLTGARYAVACGSGTDALQLALRALGIGPGDAVITSSYSFFATAEAISLVGARPVFCDIEPQTFNIDVAQLAELLARDCRLQGRLLRHLATGLVVKAIIPVHLFGRGADMARLLPLARRYRLTVIEDAAQSLGARCRFGTGWRRAGSLGALGCFSFYPTKSLGALGDGGMVVTSSRRLAERLLRLRSHGARRKNWHTLIGLNSRLDELQAAALLVKLHSLPALIRRKRQLADYYDRMLKGLFQLPDRSGPHPPTLSQYVVRCPQRDALHKFLLTRGIATEIYYPCPLHLQPCYRQLGYRRGDFPAAEDASREALALPLDPLLTSREQHRVVAACREFLGLPEGRSRAKPSRCP